METDNALNRKTRALLMMIMWAAFEKPQNARYYYQPQQQFFALLKLVVAMQPLQQPLATHYIAVKPKNRLVARKHYCFTIHLSPS